MLSSPERRRRWSASEKLRIVAESHAPGVMASEVARRYDIHPHQLHKWRQDLRRGHLRPELGPELTDVSAPAFVPVAVSPAALGRMPPENAAPMASASSGGPTAGTIEMEFANGSRMRITGAVDLATLTGTIATLASGGR